MDKKEYLCDLYEIELYKKTIYEDGIGTNIPKPSREKEFAIAVEHIAILNELLDLFEDDWFRKGIPYERVKKYNKNTP